MTDRIQRLRQESFNAQPSLSIERALIETEFSQKRTPKKAKNSKIEHLF